MLQEELKKIWIRQRVLFVVILLLAIQAGYIGFRGLYSHTVTKTAEKYGEVYEELGRTLNGRWDQTKDAVLNEWLKESERSSAKYYELVNQLLAGEISDEVLYTYYNNTTFCQSEYEQVLDELDQQRTYINKDSERRYMMKTNGWVYYFEDHFMYHLYFLFLIILLIPLFIRERETQMDLLQGLSAKGQGKIFSIKILAVVITMWGGLLLLAGEKYIFYWMRCGMEDITYPVQSLPLFENSPWRVSIGGVILIEILLLACAGYLLAGVITLCAMFIPGSMEVCLLVLVLVFVPMFLVPNEVLFRYPFLTSLLYPEQYVSGWWNVDTGDQVFKTGRQLARVCVAAISAGTILLLIARKRGQKV